jgi:hypothetical protein
MKLRAQPGGKAGIIDDGLADQVIREARLDREKLLRA